MKKVLFYVQIILIFLLAFFIEQFDFTGEYIEIEEGTKPEGENVESLVVFSKREEEIDNKTYYSLYMANVQDDGKCTNLGSQYCKEDIFNKIKCGDTIKKIASKSWTGRRKISYYLSRCTQPIHILQIKNAKLFSANFRDTTDQKYNDGIKRFAEEYNKLPYIDTCLITNLNRVICLSSKDSMHNIHNIVDYYNIFIKLASTGFVIDGYGFLDISKNIGDEVAVEAIPLDLDSLPSLQKNLNISDIKWTEEKKQ